VGQERKGRTWTVYEHEHEDFRAAVEQTLVDIWPFVFYGGRGIMVAPLRVQKDDGTYETRGIAFSEEFVPAVHETEPPEADEPLTEGELIAGIAEPVAS